MSNTHNEEAIIRTIIINFNEVKNDNSHSNRMYIMGILAVAQLTDNEEINVFVDACFKYMRSTIYGAR